MFCIHCGKQIDDESLFCIYCGNPVISPMDECETIIEPKQVKSIVNERIRKKVSPIFGVIILVLMFFDWVAIDLGYLYYESFPLISIVKLFSGIENLMSFVSDNSAKTSFYIAELIVIGMFITAIVVAVEEIIYIIDVYIRNISNSKWGNRAADCAIELGSAILIAIIFVDYKLSDVQGYDISSVITITIVPILVLILGLIQKFFIKKEQKEEQ